MAQLGRPGLTSAQRKELWRRWKEGDSLSEIGRALGKHAGSIHGVVKANGGIVPAARTRSARTLSLVEREEISRGLAHGASMRRIAARLGRAPSTVSREIARHGGRTRWWPLAHAAWEHITSEDIKVVPVPPGAWDHAWVAYDQVWGAGLPGSSSLPMVGHDRAGLLEVARRLLEPYVRRSTVTDLALGPLQAGDGPAAAPFEVIEERSWRSALLPIHLQLLEAYRRVTEGAPGAVRCRECDHPILALDPRRIAFCNDRERFRFSQRERRKRLATPPAKRGTPP